MIHVKPVAGLPLQSPMESNLIRYHPTPMHHLSLRRSSVTYNPVCAFFTPCERRASAPEMRKVIPGQILIVNSRLHRLWASVTQEVRARACPSPSPLRVRRESSGKVAARASQQGRYPAQEASGIPADPAGPEVLGKLVSLTSWVALAGLGRNGVLVRRARSAPGRRTRRGGSWWCRAIWLNPTCQSNLLKAFQQVKGNGGAPGVDGVTA